MRLLSAMTHNFPFESLPLLIIYSYGILVPYLLQQVTIPLISVREANNADLIHSGCTFLLLLTHLHFAPVGSDRRHIPGNGCIVKALEYCSDRSSINVGKPSKNLADLIAQEHHLDPSRCLFVGDRLDTDIRFGNENGMKFYLAMTGVTTAKTLIVLGQGSEQEPLPDFILPHEGMLIQMSDVSEPLFSDASFS
jgi:hypothetical protein